MTKPAKTTKPRLPYFDILKGIAIFAVVMGHVLTMCIRDIDQAFVFKLIGQTHMPLFFFISGYFAYKAAPTIFAAPKLWPRFRQLIVPAVIVGSLWVLYFSHSGLQSPLAGTFDGVIHDPWKFGYWFPLVLFEIIIIYWAMTPMLRRLHGFVAELAAMVIVSAIVAALTGMVFTQEVNDLLSFDLLAEFLPIFLIGTLAHKYSAEFNRIVDGSWGPTIAIPVGAMAAYMKMYFWEFPIMINLPGFILVTVVWHLSLAVVAFAVVRHWCNTSVSSESKRCQGIWSLLGRESLAIYLLHYFFLFPMPFMQEPLRAMGLGFVPTFIFSAFVAALVITLVLGVIAIIKRSSILSTILLGAK